MEYAEFILGAGTMFVGFIFGFALGKGSKDERS